MTGDAISETSGRTAVPAALDDPMWKFSTYTVEQVAERRAHFGHQDERDVPGYCTCDKLTRDCPVAPRRWRSVWGDRWPGDDA